MLAKFEASEVVLGQYYAVCDQESLSFNARLLAPVCPHVLLTVIYYTHIYYTPTSSYVPDTLLLILLTFPWIARSDQITGLTTLERLRLCSAPVGHREGEQSEALYHFACQYAAGLHVHRPRSVQNHGSS